MAESEITDDEVHLGDPVRKPAGIGRLDFIDLLRGLVLCLMVLDHTRDYVNRDSFLFDPLDLDKATPLLFFTRWITHLCAPTFVFLSGVSIFLQHENGKTGGRLAGFLLSRGIWLVALELTVVGFGFNFGEPFVFLQVIYAIGVGLVLMSGLVFLPPRAVLIIGIILIAGHGLFAGVDPAKAFTPDGQTIWHLLMQPGGIGELPGFVLYPAIPWFGIMCLGYGLGFIFTREELSRRRAVTLLVAGFIALFMVLRLPHLYGDPADWKWQSNPMLTALAVLKVSKYPPSLDYTLITLGVALCLSLALTHLPRFARSPLLAFGRVPLFVYIIHIYVVHGIAMLIAVGQGVPPAHLVNYLGGGNDLLAKTGFGLSLGQTYLVWLGVLIVLYPLARWYSRYKATHKTWWTSYL